MLVMVYNIISDGV